MGDMDSRIRRAIEQSAEAEAASLLERLRSRGAAGRIADGDEGRLHAGHRERVPDASGESHELQSEVVFEDMSRMISEEGDDPIALLMFGSMVRDDLPWLYEVVMEVYRDVRSGDLKTAQRAIERLRRMTKMLGRGPFMEEFASSKESHMMMMELPGMLDHLLHRIESRRLRITGTEASESGKADDEP